MTQIRKRLTYANVMSSIAVFLVLGGATAFAASKIGPNQLKANSVKTGKIVKEAITTSKVKNSAIKTGKLADSAVTGEKLGENSVTTGKIANGAITPDKLSTPYLQASTVGVPVAGASIAPNGNVNKFFNRFGGAPSVNKAGTGDYRLTFPGLEGQVYFDNSIVLVSLVGGPGEIGRTSYGGNPGVETFNSAGAAADKEFNIVIFVPGAQP